MLLGAGEDAYAVCRQAALGRSHLDHRAAFVGEDSSGLRESIDAFLDPETRSMAAVGETRRVAFVFSGQGPQWWGMGRQLSESEPVFRRKLEEVDELFVAEAGWSILEEMRRDAESSRIDETEVAQPALFAIQTGLAALWRHWGVGARRHRGAQHGRGGGRSRGGSPVAAGRRQGHSPSRSALAARHGTHDGGGPLAG